MNIQPINRTVEHNLKNLSFGNRKEEYSPYINAKRITDTTNSIKPLPGNGHLVHDTVGTKIEYFFKDIAYDAKAVKDCFNGKVDDYEAGKLNDIGLKFGGLIIATYLASMAKFSGKKQIMEFIGLGSFLLSMSIFPKLFINLPARIYHGFDIDKEYIDDKGRKKSVFQDSNYIPFDLYRGERKSEDLAVIGDRLGIPKDIQNRNDVTKEQMRKIATQNNTLWMLTAGFATPLISALICNTLEKPIDTYLQSRQNKKCDKEIEQLYNDIIKQKPASSSELKENELSANIKKILDNYSNKSIPKAEQTKIIKQITNGLNSDIAESVSTDLKAIFEAQQKIYVVTEQTINNLAKKYNGRINITQEQVKEAIGNKQTLTEEEVNEVIQKLETTIKPSQKRLFRGHTKQTIRNILTSKYSTMLRQEDIKTITDFAKIIGEFNEYSSKMNKLASLKLETVSANAYNKFTNKFIKILGLSIKEISTCAESEKKASEILYKKFEALCADEVKYKKAVKQLAEIIIENDTKLNNNNNSLTKIIDIYQRIYNNFAHNLNSVLGNKAATTLSSVTGGENVSSLEEAFKGNIFNLLDGMDARLNTISAKNNAPKWFIEAYQEKINPMFRVLQTLDLFKQTKNGVNIADANVDKSIKEYVRSIMLKANMADYESKFGITSSEDFYKKLCTILGEEEGWQSGKFANETKDVLNSFGQGENNILARLQAFKSRVRNVVFNIFNEFKPEFRLDENAANSYPRMTRNTKGQFNLVSQSPASMLTNASKQKFGDVKWKHIIIPTTAIVCGVTVLAQFFLGKIDNKHNLKKQVKYDTNK